MSFNETGILPDCPPGVAETPGGAGVAPAGTEAEATGVTAGRAGVVAAAGVADSTGGLLTTEPVPLLHPVSRELPRRTDKNASRVNLFGVCGECVVLYIGVSPEKGLIAEEV